MADDREVVITGIGVVSPIGIGRDAFAQALRERQSGISAIEQYDASALPVSFGAELKDFQPKLYVKPRKSIKVMSREIQAGVASAALAVEDASLDTSHLDAYRFGVVYGSPMLYSEMADLREVYRAAAETGSFELSQYSEQFRKQMQPLWMLKYLPNMSASHIGIAHDARGANNSIVMGDVSSLIAISEAASVIQRGVCDVMLTGGSGSRLSLTGVVYRGDSNLSHHPNPEVASRPFDAARDGMVLGEGAATLVLEERRHAENRNATIYGRILGWASTHAGIHPNQWESESSETQSSVVHAVERSIALCQKSARVQSIGQVNANGLSDPFFDLCEARAISSTVGASVPVTAPKSYFGNVGAASGAMELAASLCWPPVATEGRTVPPTLNLERLDPDCNIAVSNEPQVPRDTTVLKLNQAATGHAVSLLIDTQ